MKKEKKIGHKLPSASPPVAFAPPFTFAHSHRSLPWPSFSWRRQSGAVLHRVFVGLFADDEHPPGMPSPSLPFLLCETEHANPNLNYLCSDLTRLQNFTCICQLTSNLLQNLSAHPYSAPASQVLGWLIFVLVADVACVALAELFSFSCW